MPSPLRKSGLSAIKGTAASKVPAGQRYLQKVGMPTPFPKKKTRGRIITNSIPIGYLR